MSQKSYGGVDSRRASSLSAPDEHIPLSPPATPLLPDPVQPAGAGEAQKRWFRRKELRHVVHLFALNIMLATALIMSGSLLPQLVLLLAGFRVEDGKSESNIAAQKEATSLLTTMKTVGLFVGMWLLSTYSSLAERYNRVFLIRVAFMGICLSSLLIGCAALQPAYASRHHAKDTPAAEPRLNIVIQALLIASSVVNGICGSGMNDVLSYAAMLESTPEADRSELLAHFFAFASISMAVAEFAVGYLATYLSLATAVVISVSLTVLVCFSSFLLRTPSTAAASIASTARASESATVPAESRLVLLLRMLNPFGSLSILVLPSRRRRPDLSQSELNSRRRRTVLLISSIALNELYFSSSALTDDIFTPYVTLVFGWTPLEIGYYVSVLSILGSAMYMFVVPALTRRVAHKSTHIFTKVTVDPTKPDVEDMMVCDQPEYDHQSLSRSSTGGTDGSGADSVLSDRGSDECTLLLPDNRAESSLVLPCATLELAWILFGGVVEALTFLIQAAAHTSTLFVTGGLLRVTGRMRGPMINSIMSRLVPSTKLPQLIAASNLIAGVLGIVRPFCSKFVYQRTLDTQPASVIFISVAIAAVGCVLNLVVMLWVKFVNRRKHSDSEAESEDC
ncbi:hypothetical protein RI367_001428 [Sorochytrium milnesiophthora]